MSYEFRAKGPTKTDALLDFDAKHDKLVQDMDAHAIDRALLSSRVREAISVLQDPDYDEDVLILVSGHITRVERFAMEKRVTAVNFSVTACLVVKHEHTRI